jgi:hypothetical protein
MAEKKLSVYLMAFPQTPALAEAAVEGGADLVEIGFPFSDPLADGAVIRLAGERALAQGMRTEACLACLAETRRRVGPDVPLVPMTYASILEAYGYEHFWADARAAGATGLIVADLPLEAAPEIPRHGCTAPRRFRDLDARAGGVRSRPRRWGRRRQPGRAGGGRVGPRRPPRLRRVAPRGGRRRRRIGLSATARDAALVVSRGATPCLHPRMTLTTKSAPMGREAWRETRGT